MPGTETLTTERTTQRPPVSHRRWWIVAAAVLGIVLVGVAIAARSLSPWVRQRIVQTLEENFASRLELKSLDVSLFPSVRITGRDLMLRYNGRTDVPPLIKMRQFSAETSLMALFRTPTRINHVRVEGLEIQVKTGGEETNRQGTAATRGKPPNFLIDQLIADGTRIETIPAAAEKAPLVWEVQKLTLFHSGPNRPMSFRATLNNAKPPGVIQSTGSFGPWQKDEPAKTPVSGDYTFRNADLSVFPGISGILSSQGNYRGVLESIEVEGKTDTPDFAVSISGNRVHLTTEFHAMVDGTNGTTRLQPVVAHLGRSTLTARGIVDTTPGVPGKIISLNLSAENGRLEDMLSLAVKGKPPLTGAVSFHTKFLLPAGNRDISQKLELDGAFDVAAARFSKADAQQKVDKLSNRGRGQTDDSADDTVASNFQGRFRLRDGVMHFTDLSFSVPGVAILLNGDYGLPDGRLDLRGTARLEAKLSQTTTGFKSFLLKAADPFFKKKGAGAVLPIKITGTRDSPSFGLGLGHKAR